MNPPDWQSKNNQPSTKISATRLQNGEFHPVTDWVAEEAPVALSYNGITQVVMLVTPQHLEDFAIGYSLTEGIINSIDDIYDIELTTLADGFQVSLQIASRCFAQLKQRRRSMEGRTGCGLCGIESLSLVERSLPRVPSPTVISIANIHQALSSLKQYQPIFTRTGGTHGAAWLDNNGAILLSREDVGRHNAIDKLIGSLMKASLNVSDGTLLVTSRASFEIVQKAAAAGISVVAAVSAPTMLAIHKAQQLNITLIGFVREESCVIYHCSSNTQIKS